MSRGKEPKIPRSPARLNSGIKNRASLPCKAVGSEDSYQLSLPPGSALTNTNPITISAIQQAYSNSRASGGKAKQINLYYQKNLYSNSRASGGKAKQSTQSEVMFWYSNSRASGGKAKQIQHNYKKHLYSNSRASGGKAKRLHPRIETGMDSNSRASG